MSEKFKLRRIGLAGTIPRGHGIWIPGVGVSGGYTGGGGEYGAQISDEDITFAITREPVAYRMVFTVAHDVYDNWFELEREGDEKGKESEEFDKLVQTELTKLNAKREFTLAAVFERAYGYSIVVLGYEDGAESLKEPLDSPKGLLEIKAYGKPQIIKVETEKDKNDPRYGLPKIYHISRTGMGAKLQVHYSRVIHFATRRVYQANKNEWEGLSVLYPVWDDLVTLRNIRWGMGQTMYRYGSGFPDITFTGAEKADIDDFVDSGAFEDLSSRTYFVHSDKQSIEFKGASGHELNPMNYYLPPMEHISAGSGIPLAVLRGVQAGALTGSEVNQQEYYGLISDEQTAYEDGIRKLIDIILTFKKAETNNLSQDAIEKTLIAIAGDQQTPETKVPAYHFNWLGGFELDEKKKAEIEEIKARTLQIKGQWLKRNEIRAIENPDLPPLTEEEGGNELLGKPSGLQQFSQGETYHVNHLQDGSSTVTTLRKRSRSH